MARTAKVIATCLLLSVTMQMCCGSAIPIWEFLTRNEKMSYLYSTFAQLVSVHCKATAATSTVPVNQCKHSLLSYGYEKLQTFPDAQLDALDPYQRGASELIWSSIMRDHTSATLITTRQPLPTPPASSILILTHQKPAATAATATTTTQHQYPKNPLFENDAEHRHKYAMDMDIAYGYPTQAQQAQVETFQPNQQQAHNAPQQPQTYLTGPLVFRVRPDGTPVEEDQYRPLPRDDDLEHAYQAFGLRESQFNNNQGNNNNNNNGGNNNVSGRVNKHRKIATISALKQQHLATLALQQQLQPPLEHPRVRRQFQTVGRPLQAVSGNAAGGYFYGKSRS